jgi:hypothetical protein
MPRGERRSAATATRCCSVPQTSGRRGREGEAAA